MIGRTVAAIRGNLVAWLALFVALGGSSLAASHYLITSTQQIKPSVLRTLRSSGRAGAPGLNGATGLAGTAGSQGPLGPQGPAGANGANGANGADGITIVGQTSTTTLLNALEFTATDSLTVTAPSEGFFVVHATGTAFTSSSSCNPCELRVLIRDAATEETSQIMITDVGTGSSGPRASAMNLAWVFPAVKGANTYQIESVSSPAGLAVLANPTMIAEFAKHESP
jgi:hypothetical protein